MDAGFVVDRKFPEIKADSVVIITGGLSIPKIGAAGFGYRIVQNLV